MNTILRLCSGCFLMAALSLCGLAQAQPKSPTEIPPPLAVTQHPDIEAAFGKLPLAFEMNQGQADPAVKFLSRGPGYELFLTTQEAVMVFSKSGKQQLADKLKIQTVDSGQAAVIRIRFDGANKARTVKGIDLPPVFRLPRGGVHATSFFLLLRDEPITQELQR